MWSDDPLRDFERWDAAREEELESLPHCVCCGEPIQQEDAVYLDGYWYCDECLKSFRRETVE